ncbi:ABC transporter permease [Morganella morganii]|uniref:ABC transporter permease n=1 Tax=Morganella morganii TaxID=582 RepID=UPI0032DBB1FD
MQTFKLALRNLLRNRRRTCSTLCAIIIGAISILLFGGYNHSIEYSLKTTFVRDIGHLQIQHRDYFREGMANPQKYSIHNYQEIIDAISADPELSKMINISAPILLINGIASNYSAGTSRPVLIYGTESDSQKILGQWDEYQLGKGINTRNIPDKSVPDAGLTGKGLSRLLKLDEPEDTVSADNGRENNEAESLPDDLAQLVQDTRSERKPDTGKYIELLAASAGGAPNIVRMKVTGIQPQAARELDDNYVNVHLSQAQQLLYGNDDRGVTAIVLQLNHSDQIDEVRERLQQLPALTSADVPLAILDFTQLQPLYNQILAMFGKLFNFLLVIILCITLFTIGNTMSMAVLERTTEIGTLRAVGLKQRDIRNLFLNEGILLGVIGSVAGVASALLVAAVINISGLTWQPPGVIAPIPVRIKIWGEFVMIASVVGTLMVAAVVSSWWPSRRAANVSIVEALRYI